MRRIATHILLEEGERLAAAMGDSGNLAVFRVFIGNYHAMKEQMETALAYHEKSVEAVRSVGDPKLAAFTANALFITYSRMGKARQTASLAPSALQLLEGMRDEFPSSPLYHRIYAMILASYGLSLGVLDMFREPKEQIEKGIFEAREADPAVGGLPLVLGISEWYCGIVLMLQGELEAACDHIEEGRTIFEKGKLQGMRPDRQGLN